MIRMILRSSWLALLLTQPVHAVQSEWNLYLQRHVLPEGRVVDSGSNNISHSEGQGFCLLLATYHDDPKVFEKVWQWTQQHLGVREDSLFAWKWEVAGGVTDTNNASDADLLIAWALARAARLWNRPDYSNATKKIATAIRKQLLYPSPDGLLLLPGVEGFQHADKIILNLSYWVFPAFKELNRIDPSPNWQALQNSGLQLLEKAHFGRWQLPPDWLEYTDKVTPAGDPFRPTFGFDAIRIPLYLIWAKLDSRQRLAPFRAFWHHFAHAGFTPAWTDLTDDSVDSYGISPGMRAIIDLTIHQSAVSQKFLPSLDDQQDYYSSSLLLLTKAALSEL